MVLCMSQCMPRQDNTQTYSNAEVIFNESGSYTLRIQNSMLLWCKYALRDSSGAIPSYHFRKHRFAYELLNLTHLQNMKVRATIAASNDGRVECHSKICPRWTPPSTRAKGQSTSRLDHRSTEEQCAFTSVFHLVAPTRPLYGSEDLDPISALEGSPSSLSSNSSVIFDPSS